MSDEKKPPAVAFPDRIQPWFFLLVQLSGWVALMWDAVRPPKDVSTPLAFIFVGMIGGARSLQRLLDRAKSD